MCPGTRDLCDAHCDQWGKARADGVGRAAFLAAARGLEQAVRAGDIDCRVCPQRHAWHIRTGLCQRHFNPWRNARRTGTARDADFDQWLAGQEPFDGYGACGAAVCIDRADSPLGLCLAHESSYRRQGRPGGASLPGSWPQRYELRGLPVPVVFGDEKQFRIWCAAEAAAPRPGQINLRGLRPLARAEIQWSLFAFAQEKRQGPCDLGWVQKLAGICRSCGLNSVTDLAPSGFPRSQGMATGMLRHLRQVYFTPAGSREAGFIETGHFGVRFTSRASRIDLTGVSQRWLRDLLWDQLADLMQSPRCPRTAVPAGNLRRACTELSAFLEIDAPGGGHDPAVLRAEHAQRFAAGQRRRERDGLPSLAMKGLDGSPSTVTANTRSWVFSGARKLLRDALDDGTAERLRLDRRFITAMPAAGTLPRRARRPFPDEVARALADEANLARLASGFDPEDQGMRDIWETIVTTGRRVSEVLTLRLDCIGRHGGLPMLWHDQTKVGNLDAAIRIPERLHQVLAARQRKTLDRYGARHGRQPTSAERAALALFPRRRRNPSGAKAMSYAWFSKVFRSWIGELELGHYVAHQARHTLATSLLRHGATLTHIRRYLGHVSDRMAEHYGHLSHSDLEDVLHYVWVAGPGAATPGELLSGGTEPMTREQAQALAVDLSRRSTPAEGGFCTFQPVVSGGACPRNLDCHNCGKFVMSGADLLYWRRKREQWNSIAERAPDDATADYLHQVFEPTARAIDGLEKALAGLGLLDDALALDLRRPQDYFQRLRNTGFRAADLARAAEGEQARPDDERDEPGDELEATA